MKFKEVYNAVMNRQLDTFKGEKRLEALKAIERQTINVEQQRDALLMSLFGRRRSNTGRKAKFAAEELHSEKYLLYQRDRHCILNVPR